MDDDIRSFKRKEMEDSVRNFKRKKISDLENKREHKNDSREAKNIWRKAVEDIKDLDRAIRNGASTLIEIKMHLNHNISLVEEIDKELAEIKKHDNIIGGGIVSLRDIYDGPQFHCMLAGKSFGPVTIRQFANMARYGIVDSDTLVWKSGMSNWAVASTVADLQNLSSNDDYGIRLKKNQEKEGEMSPNEIIDAKILLPTIEKMMPSLDPEHLSPKSKIKAYDYLLELAEKSSELKLSISIYKKCAYIFMNSKDNEEAKSKILQLLNIKHENNAHPIAHEAKVDQIRQPKSELVSTINKSGANLRRKYATELGSEERLLAEANNKRKLKKYLIGGGIIIFLTYILLDSLIFSIPFGTYLTFIWCANTEKWVEGKPWINGGFIIGFIIGFIVHLFSSTDLFGTFFFGLSMAGCFTALWWLIKHDE